MGRRPYERAPEGTVVTICPSAGCSRERVWYTTQEAVRAGYFVSDRAAQAHRARRTGPRYTLKRRGCHRIALYHVDDLDAWMRGTGLQCERCRRVADLDAQVERMREALGPGWQG